jgi:hypothetical protein
MQHLTIRNLARLVLSKIFVPVEANDDKPGPSLEEQARAVRALERLGQRRGTRPWNYSRPKDLSTVNSLDYMLDTYGTKETARRLAEAARRREARRQTSAWLRSTASRSS